MPGAWPAVRLAPLPAGLAEGPADLVDDARGPLPASGKLRWAPKYIRVAVRAEDDADRLVAGDRGRPARPACMTGSSFRNRVSSISGGDQADVVVAAVLADVDVAGGRDRDVVDAAERARRRRPRPGRRGSRAVGGDVVGPDPLVALGREVDDPLVVPDALAAVEARRARDLIPRRVRRRPPAGFGDLAPR